MKKLNLVVAMVLFSFAVDAADEAEMIGDWRIFADEGEVTATMPAQDKSADLDLFCDRQHFELSVYFKKSPDGGDLNQFTVSIDGQEQADKGHWQVNARTRSALVKSTDTALIKGLVQHKQMVVTFGLTNQEPHSASFDLSDFAKILTRATSVCGLGLPAK